MEQNTFAHCNDVVWCGGSGGTMDPIPNLQQTPAQTRYALDLPEQDAAQLLATLAAFSTGSALARRDTMTRRSRRNNDIMSQEWRREGGATEPGGNRGGGIPAASRAAARAGNGRIGRAHNRARGKPTLATAFTASTNAHPGNAAGRGHALTMAPNSRWQPVQRSADAKRLACGQPNRVQSLLPCCQRSAHTPKSSLPAGPQALPGQSLRIASGALTRPKRTEAERSKTMFCRASPVFKAMLTDESHDSAHAKVVRAGGRAGRYGPSRDVHDQYQLEAPQCLRFKEEHFCLPDSDLMDPCELGSMFWLFDASPW